MLASEFITTIIIVELKDTPSTFDAKGWIQGIHRTCPKRDPPVTSTHVINTR